jgi:hypothetical protein
LKTEPVEKTPERKPDATDGPIASRASLAESCPTAAADSRPTYLPNEKSNLQAELSTNTIPADKGSTFASVVEDLGPESLWDKAYNALRKKDTELIDKYEKGLLTSQDPNQQGMPRRIKFLLARMHQTPFPVCQWKFC